VTVAIVGAGVGGLACAIDLAASGVDVCVFERGAAPGGKARVETLGDHAIDAGPTVLTMPWVFDELFARAGARFRDAVTLERADILARHAWSDGTRLDLFADRARGAAAIGEAFGLREARAFERFCDHAAGIYAVAEEHFLRTQRLTLGSVVRRFGARGIATLARLDSHRSMWRSIQEHFESPKLRQLFGRYATYCGSSPFEAPGTFVLVAHVEAEGVYRARGGMFAVVSALASLAASLGVVIRYGSDVERILVARGRVTGLVAAGERFAAEAVVFNGDVSALGGALLGREVARAASATPRDARSLSAVTWAMTARPTGFPLEHHNVFFSDDYPAEFEALLGRGEVPQEPTVYVYAPARRDGEDEPLFVLVNAPPDGDEPHRWNDTRRRRCTTSMLTVLERMGLTLAPSEVVQTTPMEFHRRFPGTGGALYGPRSRGALSALSREGSATKIPGLYLAGGSVHPGAGVPMAALSGQRAAERVRSDLASTARSRPAVITGTTSTG